MQCPHCSNLNPPERSHCYRCHRQLQRTSVPAPPCVELGVRLHDRFRVDRLLGEGGMGQVFEAFDERLERGVALKVLRADLMGSEKQRSRFALEAKALARVRHPNVVEIYDYFQLGKDSVIALELMKGGSLADKIGGGLPCDRAVALVQAVALGLSAIHAVGIIHRDLKPGNILLTERGVPKIADLGIALDPNAPRLTRADRTVGTAEYMAPEQCRGAPELRSDIYALGIVLYETLTGEVPFSGESDYDVYEQHLRTPVDEQNLRVRVAHEVVEVILRALQKDPAKRFASGDEMAAALSDLVPRSSSNADRPAQATGHHAAAQPTSPGSTSHRSGTGTSSADSTGSFRLAREVEKVMDRASGAMSSGELDEAIELFEEVLILDPDNADATRLLALCTHRKGKSGQHRVTPPVEDPPDFCAPSRRELSDSGTTTRSLGGGEYEFRAELARRESVPLVPREQIHPIDGTVLVWIPEGTYLVGALPSERADSNDQPARWVSIRGFWISKFPVTNGQYRDFWRRSRVAPPESWSDFRFAADRQPVVSVNRMDAGQYAASTGLRLPTEEEWEIAARGPGGRHFPWGNFAPTPATCWGGRPNPDCPSRRTAAIPVDALPAGASAFGVHSMAGNICEWTASTAGPVDPRVEAGAFWVRGGDWAMERAEDVSALRRRVVPATCVDRRIGFRCAL